MTTQYEKDDEKGRNIFINYCEQQPWCKINKLAKNKFAKWDVSYFSGNTQMIGEIKKRKYTSDAFSDWYIQEDKWDALIQIKGDSDAKITYINHFTDDSTMIWDLTDMDKEKLESGLRLLQENDYSDKLVWKKVYLLPSRDAVIKNKEAIILEQLLDANIINNNEEEDILPF
jgi:hypothetical protein